MTASLLGYESYESVMKEVKKMEITKWSGLPLFLYWFVFKKLHYSYSCVTLRAIPTRRLWCDRRYNREYNRRTTAHCTADCTADHPVGRAYLLGHLATDRRATAVAGRWEVADLYQGCLIFHRRLVGRRRPSPGNRGCQLSSGYCPLNAKRWYSGSSLCQSIFHVSIGFIVS